jgi:hypothetical protein
MKRLNKSGIEKVVAYIGEDRCRHTSFDGHGDLLFGSLSIDEVQMLNNINVKLENVGGGLHRVFLEQEDAIDSVEGQSETGGEQERLTSPSKPESSEQQEATPDTRDLKDMAAELVPFLNEIFPTKEEVNQAMEKMKGQMVDPEEMIDNLTLQMKSLKKQSREMDTVG